ncbi:MAG: hypothetical protein PWQ49_231 [Methanohalophilus sp.]|nr:hypothetical protein [Methanohalophilus sp.]
MSTAFLVSFLTRIMYAVSIISFNPFPLVLKVVFVEIFKAEYFGIKSLI